MPNNDLILEDTLLLYILIILLTLFVALILPIWLGKGVFYIIDLCFNTNLIRNYSQWAFCWLAGMPMVILLATVIDGVINDRH